MIETVLAFVRRMEERTRTLQAENQACKSHTEAMRMALQLLANFCTANSENQQYLWELLFPSALLYVLVLLRARVCKALTSSPVSAVSWFRDLITVSTDPQCTGHACMLLHNCTHAQSRWRAQVALSRPHMEALVAVLAHEGAGGGAYADAFEWAVLFLEAVLKDGLLSQIWANLASPTLPYVMAYTLPPSTLWANALMYRERRRSGLCSVNRVQVVLLKILDGLTDRLAKVANGYMPHPFYRACDLAGFDVGQTHSYRLLPSTKDHIDGVDAPRIVRFPGARVQATTGRVLLPTTSAERRWRQW